MERETDVSAVTPGRKYIYCSGMLYGIVLIDRIEAQLMKIMEENKKGIALHVHSFVASYLTHGLKSIQLKWFLKYKKWIKVVSRDAFPYLKYEFYDSNDKLIR